MLTHVSLTRADFAQVRQRLDSYTFLLIACTLYAASRAVVPSARDSAQARRPGNLR
jgi:hypothetical protein